MSGYKGGKWRFTDLVERIRKAIQEAGLEQEAEIDIDRYNNTIKIYYESTEEWDDETQSWRVWDEEEERWADE